MSRLLHAAARGARIGWQTLIGKWYPAVSLTYVQSEFGEVAYRIHPHDKHLQYGPISTALRDVALTGDCEDYEIPYCRFVIEKEDIYSESTEDERSMFLLFLAEALADEGM
jgi:hypothetical protein